MTAVGAEQTWRLKLILWQLFFIKNDIFLESWDLNDVIDYGNQQGHKIMLCILLLVDSSYLFND